MPRLVLLGWLCAALGLPVGAEAAALLVEPDGALTVAGAPLIARMGKRTIHGIGLARYRADGTPEPTFGTGGQMVLGVGAPMDHTVSALLREPSGSLLVVGAACHGGRDGEFASGTCDFALTRVLPQAGADAGFGDAGLASIDLNGQDDFARRGVLLADGGIVLAGVSTVGRSPAVGLVQLTSSGTPDVGFGIAGRVTTSLAGVPQAGDGAPFPEAPFAESVELLDDGMLLVASGVGGIRFARHGADGRLDPSFGQEGSTTDGLADVLAAVVMVPCNWTGVRCSVRGALTRADGDGRHLAYASVCKHVQFRPRPEPPICRHVLLRYLSDGSRDASFGTSGIVELSLPVASVLQQPDGKLIAFGGSRLTRHLLPEGTVDATFDGSAVLADVTMGGGRVEDVQIGDDGRITVLVTFDVDDTQQLAVWRLAPDGTPERDFGDQGRTLATFSVCGNGLIDAEEECDGGLPEESRCCTPGCRLPDGAAGADCAITGALGSALCPADPPPLSLERRLRASFLRARRLVRVAAATSARSRRQRLAVAAGRALTRTEKWLGRGGGRGTPSPCRALLSRTVGDLHETVCRHLSQATGTPPRGCGG